MIPVLHCVYCGARWPDTPVSWPRTCKPTKWSLGCGKTTWKNLIPVAVVIVPLLSPGETHPSRVLMVRRNIEPARGQLALVSGFMEASNDPHAVAGEIHWKREAAREILEETGISFPPEWLQLTGVSSAPTNPSVLLVFLTAPPIPITGLEVFVPNEEVSELVPVSLEDDLDTLIPWSTHREAVQTYLLSQAPESWERLTKRKTDYENALREIEKELQASASQTFLESLQRGHWKVGDNCYAPDLVPVDKDAESALEEVLSRALKLGYHDQFAIEDGKVQIRGQVNDGDLTLSLHVGMKPDPEALQKDLKRLHLNIDLTSWIRRETRAALEFADRKLHSAQTLVDSLKQRLAELPPPEPGEPEEDEE